MTNHPRPAQKKTRASSHSYRKIARRHQPAKPSFSLKTGMLWLVIVTVSAVMWGKTRFHASKPPMHGAVAPSEPSVVVPDKPAAAPIHTLSTKFVGAAEVPHETATTALPIATPATKDTSSLESTIVREVLRRDRSGNYFAQGLINGKSVRLMADTGASIVVIPEKIARAIGLKIGRATEARTAGGIVKAYETELDALTIGRIEIRRIAAMISPTMQDDFVLLGMNALGLLQFAQENDTLVLSFDPAKVEQAHVDPPPEQTPQFRRSVKECMGDGRTIDQKTLNCLQGN